MKYKICLLGDFAVGKTSLIRRFVEGRFDENYLSTIGIKVSRKIIDLESQELTLLIWDLAGGQDFIDVQPNYLRGASGAMIVCDLTRKDSLPYLLDYARQLLEVNPEAELLFIANKNDLGDEREINEDELANITQEMGGKYLLTSALTGENVENAFLTLSNLIVQTK